jgi:hypothetical protein
VTTNDAPQIYSSGMVFRSASPTFEPDLAGFFVLDLLAVLAIAGRSGLVCF